MALYRKYRPATFAEVVGQEHVTEPLSTALDTGRISHAYLFSGPRGCGKTSSARILARSLNCVEGPTSRPCGVCSSCVALAPGGPGNLDVIELDAASHGGVDDTRELRDRAFYAPAESRYRVFIVDEAHMVTTAGFNALLKIVEEPPAHLIFIFATTEPEKVLPTIRSRTHHYPFRLLPPATMRGLLGRICEQEGVRVEDAVYPLVIRAGGGSPRDSLSVLDQLLAGAGPEGVAYARALALLGVTDIALIDEAVEALAADDGAALFGAVDRVVEAGHDPRRFAGDLLERIRDLILLRAVPDAVERALVSGPGDVLDRMRDQAQRIGSATLTRYAELLHAGLGEMRGATAPRLLLEVVCARMLLPSVSEAESAALQRLERLERGIATGAIAVAPAGAPVGSTGVPVAPAAAAPVAPASGPPRRRGAEALAAIRAGKDPATEAPEPTTPRSAQSEPRPHPAHRAQSPNGPADPAPAETIASSDDRMSVELSDESAAAPATGPAAAHGPDTSRPEAAPAGAMHGGRAEPGLGGYAEPGHGDGDPAGAMHGGHAEPGRSGHAEAGRGGHGEAGRGGHAEPGHRGDVAPGVQGHEGDIARGSAADAEAGRGVAVGRQHHGDSARGHEGDAAPATAGPADAPAGLGVSGVADTVGRAGARSGSGDERGGGAETASQSTPSSSDRADDTGMPGAAIRSTEPAGPDVRAGHVRPGDGELSSHTAGATASAGAADDGRTTPDSDAGMSDRVPDAGHGPGAAEGTARSNSAASTAGDDRSSGGPSVVAGPQSGGRAGGLREVEAAWGDIRAKVREFGAAVHALLSGAAPARVDGDTIVFTHQHAPLAQRLSNPKNVEAVQSAVRAVLGRDYNVRWEVGGPGQAAAGGAARPAAGGAGEAGARPQHGAAGGSDARPQQGPAATSPARSAEPPKFSRPSQAKSNESGASAPAARPGNGSSSGNGSGSRSGGAPRNTPPDDDIPPPDAPDLPDDPGPGDYSSVGYSDYPSVGYDGVPPASTAEEEREMLAESARPVPPGDRRDPDEVALELLRAELGATRLEG
ncbi:DNA polymerase III subunit gamma and tau [Nocardia sp. alder85J]|nr:DNA polymerase III subunit gamma and tau [Nocardia sp. alder85J]MCX4093744.1 DNA polymerase III subunit gamma and tau [Nocardia sp. alder85J]